MTRFFASAALVLSCVVALFLAPGAAQAGAAVGPLCKHGYYKNSSGHCVRRPVRAPRPPRGATARCRDGTYSFSEHASGTCSHHGGVAVWIHHP